MPRLSYASEGMGKNWAVTASYGFGSDAGDLILTSH